MATETAKQKSVIAYNPTLVYEEQADGTRILRRIRVNTRSYEVPADGITVETVPDDSVGTEQIIDGSVQMQDLSDDVKSNMTGQFATDEDVKNALGL